METKRGKLVNGSVGRIVRFVSPEEARNRDLRIASRDRNKPFQMASLIRPSPSTTQDPQKPAEPWSSQATLVDVPLSDCPHDDENCPCQSPVYYEDVKKMAQWPVVDFLREGEWVIGKWPDKYL